MEHLHSRIPFARCRYQLFTRLCPSADISRTNSLPRRLHTNSNAAQANSDPIKSDNQNDTDVNDATTSTIPPSQQLPQSPLLTNPHPGRQIRHRKKRAPTPEDLSKLKNNPWAMALASPMRMCTATGSRLPKAFLTDWGLIEGPASAASEAPEEEVAAKGEKTSKAGNDSKLWLVPQSLLKEHLVTPKGNAEGDRPPLQFRMLDRKSILTQITKANAGPVKKNRKYLKPQPITGLLPFRWKRPLGPLTAHDEQRIYWREDMTDFVLKMKRQDALRQLKLALDKKNLVLRSFDVQGPVTGEALLQGLSQEASKRKETPEELETGIFMVLGNNPGEDASEGPSMPEFVTLPQNGRKVAVLNLTRLFSRTQLDELQAHHKQFQKFAVFTRPSGQFGVDAVLALWKLQEYVN